MKIVQLAKRILTGAVATGSTLLIAACYGVYDRSYIVRGFVKSSGAPVPDLEVCITNDEEAFCGHTDQIGFFHIDTQAPYFKDQGFLVCVEDVDGARGGIIKSECLQVPPNQESPVNIEMNVVKE